MHIITSAGHHLRNRVHLISWNCFKTLALFFIIFSICSSTSAQARWIRVGLATGVRSASFSGSALSARTSSGRRIGAASAFTVRAKGSSVLLNGKSYPSPVILSAGSNITFNKIRYEGEIVLRASGGRLTVINRLDVEKYLRGVLGFEVSPQWNIEVLKAQAIISRTYALSQMGRHNSSGFDVCTSDHCQVYRGANVYKSSTDRAIAQTRGKVLTYRGALAQTFFCSDSGGATADISEVWGKPVPYLIVRKEPYRSESPHAEWQTVLTASEIQAALSKKGKGVGSLKSVAISRRDAAGRATALTFTGSSGSSTMTSAAFRSLIGPKKVRSTFFEFSPGTVHADFVSKPSVSLKRTSTRRSANADETPLTPEEQKELDVLISQNKFTVDERFEMILYPERRRKFLSRFVKLDDMPQVKSEPIAEDVKVKVPTDSAVAKNRGTSTAFFKNGKITLYGRGWGHGVGLSQWGAKAMADHGWSTEKILEFYFPGTSIQRR
jgi:stage II sporulation protein D